MNPIAINTKQELYQRWGIHLSANLMLKNFHSINSPNTEGLHDHGNGTKRRYSKAWVVEKGYSE
tara:strand:- start:297 stop:488 length:192 start_codon:yes stop_codon:yes gene_type:complete